ncbi:MAG: hypothetical protein WCW02_03610 [Candidatus Buchananbacteria bacterium]
MNLQLFPIFFVAGCVVVVLVLVVIIKSSLVQNFLFRRSLSDEQKNFQQKWQQVEQMLETDNELIYRAAVVEADKLLDHALKSHKLAGADLGQRLKVAAYQFDVSSAWVAHKVRNRLVHEGDFHLDKRLAQDTLYNYKRALKNLKVL